MVKKARRWTRRERKRYYMRLKNNMRKYPSCVYGDGKIYCNYTRNYAWRALTFSFLSRYCRNIYTVSAMTAVAKAWEQVDNQAAQEIEQVTPWVFPNPQAQEWVNKVQARCRDLGKLPQEVRIETKLTPRGYGAAIELVEDIPEFTPEWMEAFVQDFLKRHDGMTYWPVLGNQKVTIIPQQVEPMPDED